MRIEQSESYQDDDWWEWAVWIEGTKDELDSIESVTYTLHSTFREPVRTVTDRQTKFRLQTEGWGVFTIYARVKFADGKSSELAHELELHYPDGTKTSA